MCKSTYNGSFGYLGAMPMYTIYAYRDPEGRDDYLSENFLRTRIMDVTDTGTYLLNGSYENDFDSYFLFVVRESAEDSKRYINNPAKESFSFHVKEFFPTEYSDSRGFKGSFSGVLYNEDDPKDSLVISQG
uniref:DUF5025 domain-containing protein n=1 Tax=Roseihalotalea indica TaxID=2867963 RepID=A0AA49JKK3_9BACT|nr:DUF5025 domain-containing protein [Tunicatimonas sp. TK19036]